MESLRKIESVIDLIYDVRLHAAPSTNIGIKTGCENVLAVYSVGLSFTKHLNFSTGSTTVYEVLLVKYREDKGRQYQ